MLTYEALAVAETTEADRALVVLNDVALAVAASLCVCDVIQNECQ